MEALKSSATILGRSFDEIKKRKEFSDLIGESMVVIDKKTGLPVFNPIFNCSTNRFNEKKKKYELGNKSR